MSLTLGLSSALSGLLTSQQALNVVSQNITNVNTPGYARQVVNQKPITLNGQGAGVGMDAPSRMVDAGLMKQINNQTSVTGQLDLEQSYYPLIENLFGNVDSDSSISATLQSLGDAFQTLATQVSQPAQQQATVQAAMDVTEQLNSMSKNLQDIRLQVDARISQAVDAVNADLDNLYSLNQKITRSLAVGQSTAELEDQRDKTLTDLAQYLPVQYYQRNDGGMVVYTTDGKVLLDSQAHHLSHTAATTASPWMTAAGGELDSITLDSDPTDISNSIQGGEIGAALSMRDTVVPNLQAQIDELTAQLKDVVNQISNRGTALPGITNSYEGSRVFTTQGTLSPETATTAVTISYGAAGSITSTTGGGGPPPGNGYGNLTFTYAGASTVPPVPASLQPYYGQMLVQANTAGGLTGLTVGSTFNVSGSAGGANDGTYRVVAIDPNSSQMIVAKSNPVQTISLADGTDTAIGLFDASGAPLGLTAPPTNATLSNIMATDYSGGGGDPQLQAQSATGPWSIDSVSKHLEAWLKQQGFTGASVGLDADKKMSISLGSTAQASLVFRDQASSAQGADPKDAVIKFDVDGDGAADQTVQGFANFFGLNDLFVTNRPNPVVDSDIQSTSFKTGTQRTLTLIDSAGQVGSSMTIPAGSSLDDIARIINANTQTNESAQLASKTIVIGSPATIKVNDSSGPVVTLNLPAGTYTLDQIANQLTSSTVTATVKQEGDAYVLSVTDGRGIPLNIDISGGTIGSSNLSNLLAMRQIQRVRAEVVPEGAGERLRLIQTGNDQLFVSSGQDIYGKCLLTDLGLGSASTGTAAAIDVRADLKTNPSAISRGTMQWNADTSQYFLSEGDNATALQLAKAMTTTLTMKAAGAMGAGSYTLSGHASASIGMVATAAANSKTQQDYQTTLGQSLQNQFASYSGVNIDEEVTKMMMYQQAYSASAKVISVLQEMMTTLTELVK